MADDDDWIVLHASPGDPGACRRRQSPSSCDSRLSEFVVLEALPAARPTDSMEGARFLAFDNDAEEESTPSNNAQSQADISASNDECGANFQVCTPVGRVGASRASLHSASSSAAQPSSADNPERFNGRWVNHKVFPNGAEKKLDLGNIEATAKWDCRSRQCPPGGCLQGAGGMRLLLARQAFEKEVQLSEKGDWRRQGLKQMLQRCYNRGESKFSSLLIPVGTESIKLCERGLALGVASSSPSLFGQVRAEVVKEAAKGADLTTHGDSDQEEGHEDHRVGLAKSWLTAHYEKTAEHDPVPGAMRTEQFSASKESASDLFKAYSKEMKDHALKQSKFFGVAKAFKAARVHEESVNEHPKCDECNRLKSLIRMFKLQPEQRAEQCVLLKEHKAAVNCERQEMNDQEARSILAPWEVLAMQVDAATQSNFLLPKMRGRATKSTATLKRMKQKIFGSMSFGEGCRIFVVPPNIVSGANLTITIIHLSVIAALRERGGVLPQELHLQLDNTTGDNKNETMMLYAAWLVQTGQFQRVRLFFLPKGHTHTS